MGSCVDISRILDLVGAAANYLDMDMCDLPVVGIAPEWMSKSSCYRMLCCSFWYRHLFRNNASNSWFFKSSGYIN